MKKVILNKSYGGFDVSMKAYQEYAKRKHLKLSFYKQVFKDCKMTYTLVSSKNIKDKEFFYTISTKGHGRLTHHIPDEDILYLNEDFREDETLIDVVEELGKEANTIYSDLVVVEIPDDVAKDYVIDNYDGIEVLHQRVKEW